jgi:phage-related protein
MRDVGHQLDKVQRGLVPVDCNPMPTIGAGVVELRIWDQAGTLGVVCLAKFANALYGLHCFKKKTPQTP